MADPLADEIGILWPRLEQAVAGYGVEIVAVSAVLLGWLLAHYLRVWPLRRALMRRRDEVEEWQENARRLDRMLAATETALEGERRLQIEKTEALERLHEEMEQRFSGMASHALYANADRFLNLVTERMERDRANSDAALARRHAEIAHSLRPFGEALSRFESHVESIEEARLGAYSALRTQVEDLAESHDRLGREAERLRSALRAPKTRGRWGELQLARVLEIAGLTEHVDFELERSLAATPEGRLRPDAVVHLPGAKQVVIDAKTPLDAYLQSAEEDDPAARREALATHVRQVRTHVRALASKAYWEGLPDAPDFVVMFIPGEAFYSAALEEDAELFDWAMRARVLIATPTTLLAILKSIAYAWQQEKLGAGIREVAESARELHGRVRILAEHWGRVGNSLGSAVGA
ncbi:MAG: DNA recombination protein RmuC, partial [Pseudomonadota bacterium]